MLVLTVRKGERVFLRDRATGRLLCEVMQVSADRGKGRLGLSADAAVEINREKVDEAKHGPPEKAA